MEPIKAKGRRLGYARVSTQDQSLALQRLALEKAGCDLIFEDHGVSGSNLDRSGYSQLLVELQEGDTIIVWRLDRLARSLLDLVDTVSNLHKRGIAFQSLCEHIDISSAYGEFVLHILGAVAHFERALIIERTKAGMQAAKSRGVIMGRKPAINGKTLREAMYLIERGLSVSQVAGQVGVSRSTLYKYLAELKASNAS